MDFILTLDRCDSASMSVRDSVIQDELSQEHQAEVTQALFLILMLASCMHFFAISHVSALNVDTCAVQLVGLCAFVR